MNDYDVRIMRQVAYVMSQSVAALCRLEGMKTLNAERARRGYTEAYVEADFEEIINEFGLGHNAVMGLLNV